METTSPRAQRIQQFRNLKPGDERVLGRLVADRQDPNKGKLKHPDLSAISSVVKRTLREATDLRNIFQVMPDLNLARDILVSAVVAPGDLATTSLVMSNGLPGQDTPLTAQLTDLLYNFHVTEQQIEKKVSGWVDDALIASGAHPILILPEASLDRMITGVDSASMESVASFGGEWEGSWFKSKGIFGVSLPTVDKIQYASFESTRNRLRSADMAEYHTIKFECKTAKKVEDKRVSLPFRVTDNLAALRMPAVQGMKRERSLSSAYGSPSFEMLSKRRRTVNEPLNDTLADGDGKRKPGAKKAKLAEASGNIYSKFFRSPQAVKRSRLEVVPSLRQAGEDTVGHPLVYHLPVESVMPICVPGDETNHVGYIVLLDANGYPLSYSKRLDFYDDLRRGSTGGTDQVGSSSQVAGELLNMANETLGGGITNASNNVIDRLAQLHGEFIDHDIVSRIKSGIMGGEVEISHSQNVDRLLFARTMKNQQTTMLYVPAELMVYMAYDYNEYGVGKSILEDAKALAAMRANLLVASVMGATRNAIPGKDINIELDDEDEDPVAAVTYLANEAISLAYHQFPTSVVSIQGLAEQLQMSGFSVNVTGNSKYPDVKTTITPKESSYVPVDNELMQNLYTALIRVFSLTPEMLDGANSPEFATTIVRNSLLLLKRVMVLQGMTNPMITSYVRTFTYNSGPLVEQMLDIIEENEKFVPEEFKEEPIEYLKAFINAFMVKLPAPETDSLEKQIEMYKAYSDVLDTVLPAFISEEYFHGYTNDLVREAVPTMVASIKGIELRRWMREKGLFRELDIFVNTEEGSPMMNLTKEMQAHVSAVFAASGDYIKLVAEDAYKKRKADERLKKLDQKVKDAMAGTGAEDDAEQTPDFSGDVPTVPGDEAAGNGDDEFMDDFDNDPDNTNAGKDDKPEDEPTEGENKPAETESEPNEGKGEGEEDAGDNTGSDIGDLPKI
jgi:hypothetical protein